MQVHLSPSLNSIIKEEEACQIELRVRTSWDQSTTRFWIGLCVRLSTQEPRKSVSYRSKLIQRPASVGPILEAVILRCPDPFGRYEDSSWLEVSYPLRSERSIDNRKINTESVA